MNRIFYALVAIAFLFAAAVHVTWRSPEAEADLASTVLDDGTVLTVSMAGANTWNGKGFKLATWDEVTPPATMRRGASLAGLPDGDALLIGGASQERGVLTWLGLRVGRETLQVTDRVERRNAQTGQWTDAAPLPEPTTRAVLLIANDGSPVIVGGEGPDGQARDGVWRYDPDGDRWSPLPRMPQGRTEHRVAQLPDGDLLVVGGLDPQGAAAIDAFRLDTDSGTWSTVPGPTYGRVGHQVVGVPQGVLVVGGQAPGMGPVNTTQLFDPDTQEWRSAGLFPQRSASSTGGGRVDPTVVGLPDGRVLAVGGTDAHGEPLNTAVLRTTEGEWVRAASFEDARVGGIGLVLGSQAVVVGGGTGGALVYRGDVDAWIPSEPATPMGKVGNAMLDRAKEAVMVIVLPLIGGMTLFLGAMKVAEAGGLMTVLARLIRPIMVRLFPEVPPDHPAMGAMILNMSANALGLGNAATPFGIRAMEQLDSLNTHKGTATNAMALFLAINTSNVTILPTGVIVLRAISGSSDPGGILVTTLFATICSTTVAIIAAKTYQRFTPTVSQAHAAAIQAGDVDAEDHGDDDLQSAAPQAEPLPDAASEAYPWWVSALVITALLSVVPLAVFPVTRPWVEATIPWIIPTLIAGLLSYGFFKGVPVYETFVAGAKDGWNVAVKIIPFVVGILVVISMLKASGAMEAFTSLIGPVTSMVGLPAEALPMALLRPLSGSGAMGVMIDTISDPAVGPDSYTGYLVSTFQGSTETTFYVLAVYFGAVGIKRVRHSMAAALTADFAGVVAAVVICSLLYA